jgi:broad specificity phosphatase PhoE
MQKIIFVRHGLTDLNKEKKWQGENMNPPLNKQGETQAEQTAIELEKIIERNGLNIEKIYSSPLLRAIRTATIIGERLKRREFAVENGLIEYSLGEWDGKSFKEVAEISPSYHRRYKFDRTLLPAPPGGKSAAQEFEYSKKTAKKILGLEKNNDILIIGHGGRLIHIIIAIMGWELKLINNLQLKNCSISIICLPPETPNFDPSDWTPTKPQLELFNSTNHLF